MNCFRITFRFLKIPFSKQKKSSLHGENSWDISSRNITVMLYLGALWSYISATRAFRAWVSRVRVRIIHNFRIFHPNNLKFWEKLLCTYMNNFPAGSFLYVELPPILFVGKVRKTRTTARINFLLNIYKQSTILIA